MSAPRPDVEAITVLIPVEPGRAEEMLAFGPVVILHTRERGAINPDNPGHVFGPFASVREAIEFTEEVGDDNEPEHDDHCYKTIIPLRLPGARVVVVRVRSVPALDDDDEPRVAVRPN